MMLRDIHPDLFRTVATPRTDELVVGDVPARADASSGKPSGGDVDAYELGMIEAFRAIARRADPAFPMTFITTLRPSTSQSPEAMRSSAAMGMLGMLAGAGLQITAVWPVRTDPPGLVRRASSDDRPSPAIIVARRRPEGVSQISVREFIRDATGPVRDAVARLTDAGMAPADIAMAALGPGLAVLTGVPAVVGADGNPIPLDDGIARLRTIAVAAMEEGDLLDEPTRQAVAWFDRHGYAEVSIDESDLTPPMAFLRLRGDRARLAKPDELAADATISTDLSHTDWHALGSLLDAHARGGDSRVLSVVTGLAGSASRARSLAYIVYAVADRRGRPADALPADHLIRAWPVHTGSAT
jgi:putative DNA methylase